jgi:hypothetical protein
MEPGSGQMLTLEKLTSHSLNVESSKKTPDKSRCETLEKILKLLKGGGSQLRCLMHTPPLLNRLAIDSLFKFPKDVETIQTAEIQRIKSEGLYEAFKETRKL